MKIIFLDVDGVLNSEGFAYRVPNHNFRRDLDPIPISYLNGLFEIFKDELQIVVSSDWRKIYSLPELREILTENGFKHSDKVIDVTEQNDNGQRDEEILDWVYKHINDVTSYAVIDDYPDILNMVKDNLILTDYMDGFTFRDLEKTIMMMVNKG